MCSSKQFTFEQFNLYVALSYLAGFISCVVKIVAIVKWGNMLSCENKKKYWLKNIDKTEDFLFVFSFSLQVRTD